MSNITCIYHANCADGFTAAWAVWKKYPNAEFIPASYGEQPPCVVGRIVVIVDFSYPRAVIDEMAKTAQSILILDHHKTAQQALAGLPSPDGFNHGFFDLLPESGVYAEFDMNRSGAMLAWNHFHREKTSSLFVDHIQDRDLWLFKMPKTKEFMANIFSYEQTFENWGAINDLCKDPQEYDYDAFVDAGAAILRKHNKDVKALVEIHERRMVIGGHSVPVASLPHVYASDAGHIMAKGNKFAACYQDTAGDRIFSLRSNDEGMDVSEIAKKYGGGGHRNAAGFKVNRFHILAKS